MEKTDFSAVERVFDYLSIIDCVDLKECCVAVKNEDKSLTLYSPGNKVMIPDRYLLSLAELSLRAYRSDCAVSVYRALCEGYADINNYDPRKTVCVTVGEEPQSTDTKKVKRITDTLRCFLYRSSRAEELVNAPDRYHATVFIRADTGEFYLSVSAKTVSDSADGVYYTEKHIRTAHRILGGRSNLMKKYSELTGSIIERHNNIAKGIEYYPKTHFN